MCIPKTSSLDVHLLRCPCCKLNNLTKCYHPRATCPNQANHRPYHRLPPMCTDPLMRSPSSPFPRRLLQNRPTDFFRLRLLQGLHPFSPRRPSLIFFNFSFSSPGGIPSPPTVRPLNAITAGQVAVAPPGLMISPISTYSQIGPPLPLSTPFPSQSPSQTPSQRLATVSPTSPTHLKILLLLPAIPPRPPGRPPLESADLSSVPVQGHPETHTGRRRITRSVLLRKGTITLLPIL